MKDMEVYPRQIKPVDNTTMRRCETQQAMQTLETSSLKHTEKLHTETKLLLWEKPQHTSQW